MHDVTRSRHGLCVLILFSALLPGAWAQGYGALGAQLFDGRQGLSAELAGRDLALPVAASRCSNCHRRDGPVTGAPAAPAFGPPLTAASLRSRQPRRGGPASSYDGASFCRLLRTGIDPAFVMIDQQMPRYTTTDAQCAALWVYLGGSGS
jgi:hypothetical protein